MNRNQEIFKNLSEKAESGKQYYFKWIFILEEGKVFEVVTKKDSKTEAIFELGRALGINRTRQGTINLVYELKPKLVRKQLVIEL